VSRYAILYDQFLDDPESLEADANADLEITRDEPVDGYLYDQAQRYFKWASLASIAEAKASAQKHLVKEVLWPLARRNARIFLERSGGRITEGALDDGALMDEDYSQGRTKLVELEEVASVFRGAERAMQQRMEMLRSLNSRQRVELDKLSS
jgi:hypothetical protein